MKKKGLKESPRGNEDSQNATVSNRCHKDTKDCYNDCFPDRGFQKLPTLHERFPITLYNKRSS